MNIRSIDLNLLVIFESLCVERNTTRAAQRLGLSQPAVSHALSRLREDLRDPLFVRASRGLVPTARALALEKPVRALLETIQETLLEPAEFDPATAKNVFRIASTDLVEQAALPSLARILAGEAPGLTIISLRSGGSLPKAELESGQLDLAIAGFYGPLPEAIMKQKLYDDDFVCLARQGHPRITKKNLSLRAYAAEEHVLITLQGDMKAKSAEILARHGLTQRFRMGITGFLAAGWVVAETDCLWLCMRSLARRLKKYLPVEIHEVPFDIPPVQVVQVWHERSHADPAHAWLRRKVHEVFRPT